MFSDSARRRFLVLYLVILFALGQWPFLAWANRIYPLVLGFPFLYAYLTAIYALILGGLLMLFPRRM